MKKSLGKQFLVFFLVFVVAFLFNLGWENAHVFLYANYQGDVISEFILLRATLGDAVMITLLSLPFIFIPKARRYSWLIIPAGLLLAIAIECYALGTHRWAYNSLMPIIPWLNVGLTPTIQLALLGYLSLKISMRLGRI